MRKWKEIEEREINLEIVKDNAPLFDTSDDGGKVIVHENDISSFFGNITASDSHRTTKIGFLQSW